MQALTEQQYKAFTDINWLDQVAAREAFAGCWDGSNFEEALRQAECNVCQVMFEDAEAERIWRAGQGMPAK